MRFVEDFLVLFVLIFGFLTCLFLLLDMVLGRVTAQSRQAPANDSLRETFALFYRLIDFAEHLLSVQERMAVRVPIPASLPPAVGPEEPRAGRDLRGQSDLEFSGEEEEEEGEVITTRDEGVGELEEEEEGEIITDRPMITIGELVEEEGEVEVDIGDLFKPSPKALNTVADMFHKIGGNSSDWVPLSEKCHTAIAEYLAREPEEPTSNHPWAISDDHLVRSTILPTRYLREFVAGVELPEPVPCPIPMQIPNAVPQVKKDRLEPNSDEDDWGSDSEDDADFLRTIREGTKNVQF